MAEIDSPPPAEEPDTPIEEVTWPDIVEAVRHLIDSTRHYNSEKEGLEREREHVLEMLQQMPSLHGVVAANGDAVRKAWYVRTSTNPDPALLRYVLADANTYIKEVVDLPKLKDDYPSVWEAVGKVKRSQLVKVYLHDRKRGEPPNPGTSE